MNTHDEVHDDGGRRLDQIRLTGISATGHHGVFPHERRDGQTFVADVVLHVDTRRAAAGDDLAHTVDYGEVAQLVAAVLSGEPADLIETVAERIAATVLARPGVHAVDVAVHKPQAPITVPFGDVVVSIRRDRTKLPAAEPYRPPTGQVRRSAAVERPRTAALPVTPDPAAAAPHPRAAATPPGGTPIGTSVGAASTAPAPTGPLPPVPAPPVPAHGAPEPSVDPFAAAPAAPSPVGARTPTDAPRPGHDTGPDGGGAVVVGPAPTGAIPTGVLPAVAAAGSTASFWPPTGADAARGDDPRGDGPRGDGHALHDDAPGGDRPGYEPDPARTELMAPLTDVVDGEIVQDALDEPPAEPVRAVLALGANLGPAQETLRQAVHDLASTPGIEIVAVSPLARTAAIGPEQPDYLNAVVLTRTTLAARDLLRAVHAVEQRHGRERLERWGPRTLDVDIVVYGDTLAVTDDLELPHPRAHERAFVLQPWAQVDPEAQLPGLGGGPVAQLAATAPDRDGVRWMALDWLTAPVPAAIPEPDVVDGVGEAHRP